MYVCRAVLRCAVCQKTHVLADGDALSGWSVHAVRLSTYNLSLCQRYTVSSSQASASDDPVPLVSELLFTDPRIKASSKACTAVLAENQLDPSYSVYSRHNLDGSATEVQQGQALNVRGGLCSQHVTQLQL